ncbi:rRNA methyltransferase 3, mitochondrial [Lithobates pipiens]
MMAALVRSMLRCSRLNLVQVSGNIQVRRDVRALRRSPVRVIPPGKEPRPRKEQLQDRGSPTQKDQRHPREWGTPTQKDQRYPQDRGTPTQKDQSHPQEWGTPTQKDQRYPQDRGTPTQKDQRHPQEWGTPTQKGQRYPQDRGTPTQKDQRHPQEWGTPTQKGQRYPQDRGTLYQKDQRHPQEWGTPTKKDQRHPQEKRTLAQKDRLQEREALAQKKPQERRPLAQKDQLQEKVTLAQQDSSQKKDSTDDQDVPEQALPVELKYERARSGDNQLGKVVSIAKSKSFRDRHGQVLLEGQRLLLDALESGAILHTLFFSRVDQLKMFPSHELQKANLVKVKFEDISLWSDVVTPQGIMGIFRKPDHVKMKFPETQLKNTLPLSLICDNIRDPGNLGTILRSAAGAGCNKVLLTKGCVDAWEPKVIRAGMGAHFRLPIINNLEWDTVSNYLSENTKVFVGDNYWKAVPHEAEFTSGKAIDYGWISNDPRRIGYVEGEDYYSSSDEEDEEMQDIPRVPIQQYHEPWARGPSALVIGGETHGLSIESLLLAKNSGGRRLYIPVVPGIESLNSAMAVSILLFEGRRQLQLESS